MKDFLLKHKTKLAAAVVALLLLSGGFALGRFGQAEHVVYKEREKVVEVEKIVYVDREKVVEKVVTIDNTKTRIVREEKTTKLPDGTETTTKTEKIGVDKDVSNVATKVEEKLVYVDRDRVVTVEKEVFVDKTKPMPDWRIGAMAGLNFPQLPGLVAGDSFDVLTHTVFGLQVERRIVGPLSVGAWGLSSGTGGLTLNLEF